MDLPTVVREKGLEFIVHTRELPFEPPHVHARFGDDEVRIELNGGTFMEELRRANAERYCKRMLAMQKKFVRFGLNSTKERGKL